MKSRAMLSAVLMLMILAGCAPAPQIIREVVIVTATPKPVVAVAKPQSVSQASQVDEWIRLLERDGWQEMDNGDPARRGLVRGLCSIIQFQSTPSGTLDGFSYGIDFDGRCDGALLADIQTEAYITMGMFAVDEWVAQTDFDTVFSGEDEYIFGECGEYTCGANMASDSMLAFHVYFD